ncbi:hypothetical protein Tco_1338359 [Tanacetum coccineum]
MVVRGCGGVRGCCSCGVVVMVEADGVGQRCDDGVMVMFDEEMWWDGDGWPGEAAGGTDGRNGGSGVEIVDEWLWVVGMRTYRVEGDEVVVGAVEMTWGNDDVG